MNPQTKGNLDVLNADEVVTAKQVIEELYLKMVESGQINVSTSIKPPAPLLKRPKSISLLLNSSSTVFGSETIEDEIKAYSNSSFNDDHFSMLEFWFFKKTTFPKLAQVAMYLNSIPATSNATERLFSQAKLTMTHLRTSLNVNKFEKLLVIKLNGDLCEEYEDNAKPEDENSDSNNELDF